MTWTCCICLSHHEVILPKSFILKKCEVGSCTHLNHPRFYLRVSTPTNWTSHLTFTVTFTTFMSAHSPTEVFPIALERSAAPILRECSINCWGDPWQQRSSEPPPSLSTSLTHSLSQTHSSRLYTLCVAGMHRGGLALNDSRWQISLSRWPTGSQSVNCPKAALHQRQVTADRTRTSDHWKRPHFWTEKMVVANVSRA